MSEAGVPGFEASTWHGVVVPAATPGTVVNWLNEEINFTLNQVELRDRLGALGAEVTTGTPREFADYIAREIPKWAKIVRDSRASTP